MTKNLYLSICLLLMAGGIHAEDVQKKPPVMIFNLNTIKIFPGSGVLRPGKRARLYTVAPPFTHTGAKSLVWSLPVGTTNVEDHYNWYEMDVFSIWWQGYFWMDAVYPVLPEPKTTVAVEFPNTGTGMVQVALWGYASFRSLVTPISSCAPQNGEAEVQTTEGCAPMNQPTQTAYSTFCTQHPGAIAANAYVENTGTLSNNPLSIYSQPIIIDCIPMNGGGGNTQSGSSGGGGEPGANPGGGTVGCLIDDGDCECIDQDTGGSTMCHWDSQAKINPKTGKPSTTVNGSVIEIPKLPIGAVDNQQPGAWAQNAYSLTGWAASPATVASVTIVRDPWQSEDPDKLVTVGSASVIGGQTGTLTQAMRQGVQAMLPAGYPQNQYWQSPNLAAFLPFAYQGMLYAIATDIYGQSNTIATIPYFNGHQSSQPIQNGLSYTEKVAIAGTVETQMITVPIHDINGANRINAIYWIAGNSATSIGSCYVEAVVNPNQTGTNYFTGALYLQNDAGTGWLSSHSAIPGPSTLNNGQCAINYAEIVGNLNEMSLVMNVSFKPAFSGEHFLYSYATDVLGYSSPYWSDVGQVTAIAGQTGTIALQNPNQYSGINPAIGSTQVPTEVTFPVTFSDATPAGGKDVNQIDILVNQGFNGASACYVSFFPSAAADGSGMLGLVQDNGTTYSYVTYPGTGSVSNSQCKLSAANSYFVYDANAIHASFDLTMTGWPSFWGNKSVWAHAHGIAGNDSGWVPYAAWMIP